MEDLPLNASMTQAAKHQTEERARQKTGKIPGNHGIGCSRYIVISNLQQDVNGGHFQKGKVEEVSGRLMCSELSGAGNIYRFNASLCNVIFPC